MESDNLQEQIDLIKSKYPEALSIKLDEEKEKLMEEEDLKQLAFDKFFGVIKKRNRKSNRSRYVQRIGNKFIQHKR